jgi:hypothetical protein
MLVPPEILGALRTLRTVYRERRAWFLRRTFCLEVIHKAAET